MGHDPVRDRHAPYVRRRGRRAISQNTRRLCGAVLLVILALILGVLDSYDQIYEILSHDLNIFGVIIGTGILVDVVGRSGLFHFISMILCSLVLVICRALDYPVKPFLLSVAICANSGAIVTFASGLPNMIGTQAHIPYMHFLLVSAPYAVVSFVMAVIVLRISYSKSLRDADRSSEPPP